MFEGINVYLALAVNGACSGLGAALGSYIANNHLIKRTEQLAKKAKTRLKQTSKKFMQGVCSYE